MAATLLTNITNMLTDDILPLVASQNVAPQGGYELIPVLPRELTAKTGVVSLPTGRNTYAVNTLADNAQIARESKAIAKNSVTPVRKYAAGELSGRALQSGGLALVQNIFNNLVQSVWKNIQSTFLTDASNISGIDAYGTDNANIARASLESLDAQFYNDELGDISAGERVLLATPASINTIKNITGFANEFSYTGEITRSMIGEIYGMPVITTPATYLPSGSAGKENLAIWTRSLYRVFQDDAPDASMVGNSIEVTSVQEFEYRGARMFVWAYEDPSRLSNYIMAVTTRTGMLVDNADGVKILRGK